MHVNEEASVRAIKILIWQHASMSQSYWEIKKFALLLLPEFGNNKMQQVAAICDLFFDNRKHFKVYAETKLEEELKGHC